MHAALTSSALTTTEHEARIPSGVWAFHHFVLLFPALGPLDILPRAPYPARMSNPTPADLLWQVHYAALEGRSSATGAALPTSLEKSPPGAQAAHHAMVCFEALRRGESLPARPPYLDDLRASIAEDAARKLAATPGKSVTIGPPDDPPPPPPPTKLASVTIGPPDDPEPPPPPPYVR